MPKPGSSDSLIAQPQALPSQGLSLESGCSPGYEESPHYGLSKLKTVCVSRRKQPRAPVPGGRSGSTGLWHNLKQSTASQHNLGWKRPLEVTECNHKPNTAQFHQTMALLSQEPDPGWQTRAPDSQQRYFLKILSHFCKNCGG